VTLYAPRPAEANVAQHDRSPSEEGRKSGEGEEPGKDGARVLSQVDVGERTECKDEDDGEEGAARFVNICEEPWGVACFGECGKRTRPTVDAGETNGEDRDANGDIDQVVDTPNFSPVEHANKGGCGGRATSEQEELVVVGEKKTNHQERKDIDDRDTPESIFNGGGHGLAGVGGLRRGETNEFCSSKGKGSGDEDGADTGETMGECSRILPVTPTDVSTIIAVLGPSTANADEGDEDEEDDDEKFETG